jgi:ECF sigma factor
MSDGTRILQSIDSGDPRHSGTAEELLPKVYDELRRLAASKLAGEATGHTLQRIALVHEAWLRMEKQRQREFDGRTGYFKAAEVLEMSVRSAERRWAFCRAWLRKAIAQGS